MLTAIGLTPGGSSTVHSYMQTIHRTTQLTTRTTQQQNNTTDNKTTQLARTTQQNNAINNKTKQLTTPVFWRNALPLIYRVQIEGKHINLSGNFFEFRSEYTTLHPQTSTRKMENC